MLNKEQCGCKVGNDSDVSIIMTRRQQQTIFEMILDVRIHDDKQKNNFDRLVVVRRTVSLAVSCEDNAAALSVIERASTPI